MKADTPFNNSNTEPFCARVGKKYVVVTISIQERPIDKIFVAAFTQKWEW
jgi:hypothetical protein